MAFSTEAEDLTGVIDTKAVSRIGNEEMFSLHDFPPELRNDILLDDIHVMPGFNHRKTFDEDSLRELGLSIEKKTLISSIFLIKIDSDVEYNGATLEGGNYYLIAGERRTRAMKDFTGLEVCPKAEVYPQESLPWIMTISLIENFQRETPPVNEAIEGMRNAITTEYMKFENPKKAFIQNSGLNSNQCSQYFKISEAIDENSVFKKLVEKGTLGLRVLYNFAQACLNPDLHKTKKDKIQRALELLEEDDLSVNNVAKFSEEVKNYSKGVGKSPLKVKSKSDLNDTEAENKTAIKKNSQTDKNTSVVTAKKIDAFHNLLSKPDLELDQDLMTKLGELQSKINEIIK